MARIKNTVMALLAVILLPMAANADPIEGDIGITGSLLPTCSGGQSPCTMDIADGVDFSGDLGIVVFSTGDFAGFLGFGNLVTMTDFVFNPFANVDPLWAGGGFSFALETLAIVGQSSNFLELTGTGTISGNAFDDTAGLWSFSADAASGNITFAWSSTTANVVPEPGTLALLGLGLFGMGLARRRRQV